MTVKTITGNDTLTLFDRVITGLADGDVSTIQYQNDLVAVKTGKNNNSLYSRNAQGEVASLTLRVNRGCADDLFLQEKLNSQIDDLPAFTLATGQLVKRLGDGEGNVLSDTYDLDGGVFDRAVEGKDNVEGDTDAAVATYSIRFARARRTIG